MIVGRHHQIGLERYQRFHVRIGITDLRLLQRLRRIVAKVRHADKLISGLHGKQHLGNTGCERHDSCGRLGKIYASASIVDVGLCRNVRHERHAGENALLPTFHVRRLIVCIRKSCRCNDEHTCCHQQPGPPPTMPWRGAHIKNPQGLTDPEDCTRNSSSPVPQPSRERWSILQEGLLAHGSPYSPCLPIRRGGQWHSRVSSPLTAAGPRGIYTLFPYPGVTMWRAL
jgi:hypothetical protein